MHTYLHSLKNKGCIRTFYLLDDYFYNQYYLFSGLELYVRYDQQVKDPNMQRYRFPKGHFVCAYTRNLILITASHIWTLYTSNDCSTIRDVNFLC